MNILSKLRVCDVLKVNLQLYGLRYSYTKSRSAENLECFEWLSVDCDLYNCMSNNSNIRLKCYSNTVIMYIENEYVLLEWFLYLWNSKKHYIMYSYSFIILHKHFEVPIDSAWLIWIFNLHYKYPMGWDRELRWHAGGHIFDRSLATRTLMLDFE